MFPASLTLSALHLKAAAAGALVAIAAAASLTAWAFYERSRYFDCRATVAPLVAQLAIVVDRLEDQGLAIEQNAELGRQAIASSSEAARAARAAAQHNAGAIAQLDELVRRTPAPNPDGTAKGCRDARRELRSQRGAP